MSSGPPPISPDTPWLAPLAGYSDLPFRLLCREGGAAVCVTEMVSAKGMLYDSPGTERLLDTDPADSPLVVQLFGRDPEIMATAMDRCLERGFSLFDLNAGCPVPKVAKTGCGAALLDDPETLLAVVHTMVRLAPPGCVGVKYRLGIRSGAENYLDLGRRLADAGVGWLTLHPRTARQGYGGTAHWPALAELSQVVSIPVLASGDLFTPEDGIRCMAETGAAGLMFARGALNDPHIFRRYLALRQGQTIPPATGPELAALIRRHVQLIRRHGDPGKALLAMRTVIPRYVKSLPGAKAIRTRMVQAQSWEEVLAVAEELGG